MEGICKEHQELAYHTASDPKSEEGLDEQIVDVSSSLEQSKTMKNRSLPRLLELIIPGA
jgi:hypothetical protein